MNRKTEKPKNPALPAGRQKTKEIVVATRNKKKLAEIKELTRDLGLKVLSLEDIPNAPYVREDGKTFSENADKKALKIARFSGRLTLGEDSGLCIDALGGAPGIASARFSGKDKSDLKNNLKALRLLEGIPLKKRTAHYVCAVSIADKDGLVGRSAGRCKGLIGFEMKGSRGFGYDPIFVIPKHQKTFAQLGENIKHTMSHRYKALKKAQVILRKFFGVNRRQVFLQQANRAFAAVRKDTKAWKEELKERQLWGVLHIKKQ